MKRSFRIQIRWSELLCAVLIAFTLVSCAQGQQRYQAVRDSVSSPTIPYTRYFTKDKFDRQITFYIHGDQSKRLPIVVSVLGSGAYSNFIRIGDEIRDGHRAAREAFGDRAHVVVVEKPGIEFLEQHGPQGNPSGTEAGASPEFLRENTLDRWAEAVNAALRAARSLPSADRNQTLLIGHSEGATVVALAAAENEFVTHVASLSGNGPSLLFELLQKAREGRLYPDLPADSETQLARLFADVAAVNSEPQSITDLVLGHSHLYWSSRWKFSTLEELSRTNARIFLAHGSADRNVSVANFDVLHAQLLASGKDVTPHRFEGADHGYRFDDQPERDGWKEVFEKVREWFLGKKE